MEIKYKEFSYFRHIFEKLVKSIYQTGKFYFLDNASQIYYELLVSFSRIQSLLYTNPLLSPFLEKYETIYYCYSWILKKIDPVTSRFSIPSILKLNKIIKTLFVLVKEIIPLLTSSKYPDNDKLSTNKIQYIINRFI